MNFSEVWCFAQTSYRQSQWTGEMFRKCEENLHPFATPDKSLLRLCGGVCELQITLRIYIDFMCAEETGFKPNRTFKIPKKTDHETLKFSESGDASPSVVCLHLSLVKKAS